MIDHSKPTEAAIEAYYQFAGISIGAAISATMIAAIMARCSGPCANRAYKLTIS
jgi:hypothetical protein